MVTLIFLRGLCGYVQYGLTYSLPSPPRVGLAGLYAFTQLMRDSMKLWTPNQMGFAGLQNTLRLHKSETISNYGHQIKWLLKDCKTI